VIPGPRVVVLAGGRAERLGGAPKPLLRHPDGRSLLAVLVEAVRAEGLGLVAVAPVERRAALQGELPGPWLDDPGEGPAGGLYAAVAAAPVGWLCPVGADHPTPAAGLVGWLASRAEPGDRAVAVRRPDGGLEPLWSLLDAAAIAALPATERPRSLVRLLERLDARAVPREDVPAPLRLAFADVDTWAEARAAGLTSPEARPEARPDDCPPDPLG
jgi:molybdopterin-guanine dinucleotide biosynthesis protein A